jgi:hypothetical protein
MIFKRKFISNQPKKDEFGNILMLFWSSIDDNTYWYSHQLSIFIDHTGKYSHLLCTFIDYTSKYSHQLYTFIDHTG